MYRRAWSVIKLANWILSLGALAVGRAKFIRDVASVDVVIHQANLRLSFSAIRIVSLVAVDF
jgi:hypothetical protein